MADFYDFIERLEFSEGVELTETMLQHIFHSIPAAKKIEKARNINEDLNGTDYWVHRHHGLPSISIDMKNREICPIEQSWGDDVCIETTSQYRGPQNGKWLDSYRMVPGWTVNEKKRTDLIVYTWPHHADLFGADYVRFWILYFPHLCAASLRHWREWASRYGEKPTPNRNYITLNTYVPRKVVTEAIKELTSGIIPIL
jgi:hypothetical protein